ncbi:M57 family metalloprotease [Neolewinella antarctica]|uniref:Peptidase n=1 Tax=Neolewinella antarctica TaxID=442734 RepID=A0ABX0XDD9_9BACT|nr:M57 family metalloprotease [Neolewinella antarctica]NJC26929.1 hypothetical protein [Neolewinella antarctica]
MQTKLFTAAVCGLFAFSSCVEDTQTLAPQAEDFSVSFIEDVDETGHTDLTATPFDDALSQHAAAASENYHDAERVTVERPDGTVETLYRVGGDIDLTKSQLEELRGMDDALLKQYRTNNLVTKQTINVVGYTGGTFALTSKMQTALQWTVNNYNALNINKTFNLRFAASTNGDIVVYRQPNNDGAGGIAGFPSGGRPFKYVQIYTGMDQYDTNTNEHVITHEIGHCMGLRHTDYATRQSCNQSGEGAGRDGAVYIPGTPRGFDANSVMLACFSANEDGEFGQFDRVALETIY